MGNRLSSNSTLSFDNARMQIVCCSEYPKLRRYTRRAALQHVGASDESSEIDDVDGLSKQVPRPPRTGNLSFLCCMTNSAEHIVKMNIKNILCLGIQGNIGAGKSTLLRRVQKRLQARNLISDCNIIVIPEPVDGYNTFQEFHPLQLCSENMSENAVATQLHIIECVNDMLRGLTRSNKEIYGIDTPLLLLLDRDHYSPMIFIEAMEHLRHINRFTSRYMQRQCLDAAEETFRQTDLLHMGQIYIKTDADECLKRIEKRGRPFEQTLNIDYLRALEVCHENFLSRWTLKCNDDSAVHTLSDGKDMVDQFIGIIESTLQRFKQRNDSDAIEDQT